jgi:hypothetical protein
LGICNFSTESEIHQATLVGNLATLQKSIFQDPRALTTYFVFDRWLHLFSFMLDEFKPPETDRSSESDLDREVRSALQCAKTIFEPKMISSVKEP